MKPEKPIVVYDVKQTCGACPSSWEGRTEDGREVYARYRWGYLSVRVGDEQVFGEQLKVDTDQENKEMEEQLIRSCGEERAKSLIQSHRNLVEWTGPFSYDGTLSYDELKAATREYFWWT